MYLPIIKLKNLRLHNEIRMIITLTVLSIPMNFAQGQNSKVVKRESKQNIYTQINIYFSNTDETKQCMYKKYIEIYRYKKNGGSGTCYCN